MQGDRREFTARLGAALRSYRKAAGITQVDLAAQLGEPQSFVSRYETGERRLEFFDVLRVCRIVGVSLEELVATLEVD